MYTIVEHCLTDLAIALAVRLKFLHVIIYRSSTGGAEPLEAVELPVQTKSDPRLLHLHGHTGKLVVAVARQHQAHLVSPHHAWTILREAWHVEPPQAASTHTLLNQPHHPLRTTRSASTTYPSLPRRWSLADSRSKPRRSVSNCTSSMLTSSLCCFLYLSFEVCSSVV